MPGRGVSLVSAHRVAGAGALRGVSGTEPAQLVFLSVHRAPRTAPAGRNDRAAGGAAETLGAARACRRGHLLLALPGPAVDCSVQRSASDILSGFLPPIHAC